MINLRIPVEYASIQAAVSFAQMLLHRLNPNSGWCQDRISM